MSMVLSVVAVGPEVPQHGDLGAVVDDLTVDVQDERAPGVLGPGTLGGADRHHPASPGRPAADAGQPPRIPLVELAQRLVRAAGVGEGCVVDRRTAEVAGVAGAEAAD